MKVFRKIVGKTKIDIIKPIIQRSDLLMSGWKEEEEENGTNI